jgi:hypothetical protein
MVVHVLSSIVDDLVRIRKRSFLSFRRKPESRNTKTSGPRLEFIRLGWAEVTVWRAFYGTLILE